DGRWLVLSYFVDTRSNDLWLVDFEAYRATGTLDRVEVSRGTPGLGMGTVVEGPEGDTLVLNTYKGAPNGRVVVAPASDPSEANWRDLVPERSDAAIEVAHLAAGHVVVTSLRRAVSHVEVFDLTGRLVGQVPLPTLGTAEVAAHPGS